MLRREHNFKAGELVTVVRGVYYGMNGRLADRGVGIIVGEGPDDKEYARPAECVCILLGGDRIDIHYSNLERVK